jgi:hypothetical protein
MNPTRTMLLFSIVLGMSAMRTASAACVSFNSFPVSNSSTILVKLTFAGLQEKPVQSLAFAANPAGFDPTLFAPCESASISYTGDGGLTATGVSNSDIASLLQAASAIPAVTGGGATTAQLSFSLYDTATMTGFEVLLSQADGISLLQALRTGDASNQGVVNQLNTFGCFSDLKDPTVPTDITASVPVSISGIRLNRQTGRYVGTATATNNSASTIPGPVSLVLNFGGQVQLNSPSGLTCGTSPVGVGYLNLPLVNNSLPGGAMASVTLDLLNPVNEPVTVTTKVLGGAGAR